MHRLLLLALICGCEQIEPSGNPLQPAKVAAAAPTVVPVHVVDGVAAIEDSEETFSLSSEEMAPGAPAEVVEKGADHTPPSAEATPVATATDDVAPTASASVSTPVPAATASIGWPQQVGKAWPVRLVTTVPNASPPRAILGLPDGKEIVVNPGSMVPDFGLVVVAISPGAAELAKIAPAGDHATIESVTLRAQY